MNGSSRPNFPSEWQPLVDRAADALRELALNEQAKAKLSSDPMLRPFLQAASQRYIAGQTTEEVLDCIASINDRGHAATVDYMGESCREEAKANHETQVFLTLIEKLENRGLDCSISLDISHVGSVIDPELGFQNTKRIAEAAAAIGQEVMISMEGSDRTDNTLNTYHRLQDCGLGNVGITIQARLHRTKNDLPKLLECSGRIRLVKGAYIEPTSIAFARNSQELAEAYRHYAKMLLDNGHKCSVATHDRSIQVEMTDFIEQNGLHDVPYEFESLIGLGTEQIDGLQQRGFNTREYAVYGEEWFLYLCNRIAEEPIRLYQTLIDLMSFDKKQQATGTWHN